MMKDASKKRRYSKPRVEKVGLKAEEVLAAGCKTDSTGGPAKLQCIAGCATDGS